MRILVKISQRNIRVLNGHLGCKDMTVSKLMILPILTFTNLMRKKDREIFQNIIPNLLSWSKGDNIQGYVNENYQEGLFNEAVIRTKTIDGVDTVLEKGVRG